MTPERLAEIEARAEAATAGCWLAIPDNTYVGVHVGIQHESTGLISPIPRKDHAYADANFIAHARTDIPDLIAEVKRLKKIESLRFGLCEETGEDNQG